MDMASLIEESSIKSAAVIISIYSSNKAILCSRNNDFGRISEVLNSIDEQIRKKCTPHYIYTCVCVCVCVCIMVYLLHARTDEPQKQPFPTNTPNKNRTTGLYNPFLWDGSVNTFPHIGLCYALR
jgi:hypothetical protein